MLKEPGQTEPKISRRNEMMVRLAVDETEPKNTQRTLETKSCFSKADIDPWLD